jgi:hypothetical protein
VDWKQTGQTQMDSPSRVPIHSGEDPLCVRPGLHGQRPFTTPSDRNWRLPAGWDRWPPVRDGGVRAAAYGLLARDVPAAEHDPSRDQWWGGVEDRDPDGVPDQAPQSVGVM